MSTDDNDLCTLDGCNSIAGIFHNPLNTDDNNMCTFDGCNPALGIFHFPISPDDNNPCTIDGCNSATGPFYSAVDVNDHNLCTADGCNPNTGVFHNTINVDDKNPCTTDGCDPLQGPFHTPVNTNDGNACTTDACNSITGAITHVPVNTNDGSACTIDACDPQTGVITHAAIDPNDGSLCTTDGCLTSSGVFHTPVETNDGNACTFDVCDPVLGVLHLTINSNDNNLCTVDGCNTSTGVFHTDVNVDDLDKCTIDGCNPTTGIFHIPVLVDDNNACTADACNKLTGVISNTLINTNDNNICTDDGCNTLSGVYHNLIATGDGNACTTDGCDPLNGIYHIPVNINDDNVCTTDACNTSSGVISHTDINVIDGNACTMDGCNSVTGVYHDPISITDNNPCTTDGCDVITGVYHNPVNTNDGNPCTIDACNTQSGAITNTPSSPIVTATAGTISCYGGTTCITVTATGGLPPYNGTGILCGYGGGQFTLNVADSKGCIATSSLVIISEPGKIDILTSSTAAGCAMNNGTATAAASGGTPGYSYVWTPGGQTTNPATGLAPGLYSVKVTDSKGCTETNNVTVGSSGSLPGTPGPISGPIGACKKQTGVVYCVTPVPGAVSYMWTLPSGASAVGSTTGSCITLKFNSKFNGGFICVKASNPCGNGQAICMMIIQITSIPAMPSGIAGPATLCPLTNGNYTASNVINATSYIWSATGGLSVISGQGSASVIVRAPAGFAGGSLSVKTSNCKGTSGLRTVNIGLGAVCKIAAASNTSENTVAAAAVLTALNAYPNPTSGKLTITFNSERNVKYSLKVVNVIGSLMIDDSISALEGYNMKEINLENVAKGLYFISLQTEGAEAKTLRIIVE